MKTDKRSEELRKQIIIAMLEEFPALKVHIKSYLEEQNPKQKNSA
jgi:hypothetical protein